MTNPFYDPASWDISDEPLSDEGEDFVFEMYLSMGKKPEDLTSPGKEEYAAWLKAREAVAEAKKADPNGFAEVIKANPFHDEAGRFTTKDKATFVSTTAAFAKTVDKMKESAPKESAAPWKKESGNLGSNPGGVYSRGDKKFYVKFPNEKGQILSEQVADSLYEMLGVGTVNHKATDVDGKLASVSEWKEVKQLGRKGWAQLTPEDEAQAAKAYVASALTNNWDVVGLTYDNMGKDKAGRITILDTGGSFKFRAQGGPKDYGPDATTELKTMLNPAKASGSVYSVLYAKNKGAFTDAAKALQSIADDDLVKAVAPLNDETITKNIVKRKNSILKFLGV